MPAGRTRGWPHPFLREACARPSVGTSGEPGFERCLVFPVEGAGVVRFDQKGLVKSLFT